MAVDVQGKPWCIADALTDDFPRGWRPVIGRLVEIGIFDAKQEVLDELATREEFKGRALHPNARDLLHMHKLLDPSDVKVVIMGQDPYPTSIPNRREDGKPLVPDCKHKTVSRAVGMSFSVRKGSAIPISLQNIFKAIERTYGVVNTHGDLTNWCKEGVFLLNASLAVFDGKAGGQSALFWKDIVGPTIDAIISHNPKCIFVAWGNVSQTFLKPVLAGRGVYIQGLHPAERKGRFVKECDHFREINKELGKQRKIGISWCVDPPKRRVFDLSDSDDSSTED